MSKNISFKKLPYTLVEPDRKLSLLLECILWKKGKALYQLEENVDVHYPKAWKDVISDPEIGTKSIGF